MKKITKKFFALLLTMFMLASLIPFAALAEGEGGISPSEEIQSEFSVENGYTPHPNWVNDHYVIPDNFCGISGVSAVCDVFAYKWNSNTTVYVCDITITIGKEVNSDKLLISDILSNIGNEIVIMPGGYIRFNIHIVDNSGKNYQYLPGSLDMSTPDWVCIDYGESNNRGNFTWNRTFEDLGFNDPAAFKGKYLEFATALMNKYSDQYFEEGFSLTYTDGTANYDACNTVLERVLDDYYIEYFNKKRDEGNKITSLAELTLEEVEVVAKPDHSATIVDNSEMLNEEISEHIYWRYFYEHCLHAGDSTLVPNEPADQQYWNVYHAYADKTGEPYANMQQLFANSINTGTTMKFGVKLDGSDTQNVYQNYEFLIRKPASFTLVKPADEKEDLPGLKKWIVTILDVEDQIVPVEEGNPVIPEPPEGYEVIGPILEERSNEDGTTSEWLTGWKIKVKSDTIGAGDTVDFLLESNLGTDFLRVFPANWPLNDSHNPADDNWTVDDFGDYVFTFHDVMAQELVLNENSFIVKVGDYTLLPGEYNLVQNTEDGCTFEIVIDKLVQLFLDGKFDYAEIGTLPITVEYSATASETLSAGSYINRAWVTANNYSTQEDQVEVITYALQVYKHDSAELNPVDPDYTPMPLAGAIFNLYKAEQGHAVIDENGNVIGWAPYENELPFKQGTTNENGQLINIATGNPIFDGLDAGTYYIVEVQAPDGYVCDRNYYPINIGGNNDEGTPVVLAGFTYTYDVPNVLVPHTGGTGTVIFSVVGACMLVCAGAMYIIYRRRLRTEA